MNVTFRPIDIWPQEQRRHHRRSQFGSSYQATLNLLERELGHLVARHIVIQLAVTEDDIRNDGLPRATAHPKHPGVIVAFDSKFGPLKYLTDEFDRWQDNLRAIALSLEALRKVDRYGVSRRGEQYTGWRALPAGVAMPAANRFASLEDAACFMAEAAGDINWAEDLLEGQLIDVLYRDAAKRLHPDVGGDAEEFKRLGEARRMLVEGVS